MLAVAIKSLREARTVLLFGLQGRLFRSEDAGASWMRIETGTEATLSSGLRLAGGGAMIVGYAGVLLNRVGTPGGLLRIGLENRPAVSDAQLLDNGDLLTVGEGGIRRWPAAVISGQ